VDRAEPPEGAADPRPAQLRLASPGRVLLQGLAIPGLGQHATGRSLWGVGVLAAAGGAFYLAAREETVVRRVQAQDPFGNRYEYDVRVRERPYQTFGIAAAVAIGVAAAFESYLYARRSAGGVVPAGGDAASLHWLSVSASGDEVRVGVRVPAKGAPRSSLPGGS
jgi:hypothetical protein